MVDDKRVDDLVSNVARIADKVDHLTEMSVRNSITLDKNTEDMAEHILRTNLLQTQMRTALIPIKVVKWLGGSVAFISVLVGLVLGILQLFGISKL